MKIAIVGCGAAGSVFASYLKAGGDDIYMIDLNRAHMKAVAENGLLFKYPGGEKRFIFVTNAPAGGPPPPHFPPKRAEPIAPLRIF